VLLHRPIFLGRWPLAVILALLAPHPGRAAPPVFSSLAPRGIERGKTVDIVVTGSGLTTQTRLVLPFKATQKLLAEAKPNPAQARIRVTVDADVPLGLYPVRVATEEGISGFLLWSVDAFPNVEEVENNDTFARAQKVPFGVIVSGSCPGGDVDFYRFPARKGRRVVVETEAARLGSGIMPQIRVTDARQRLVAADDSQQVAGDCRVTFVPPADGDYVVEISDSRYRGGNPPFYRLKIGDYDVVEEVFPLGGRRGQTVTFTLRGGTLAKPIRVRHTLPAHDQAALPLRLDGAVKAGMLSPRLAVGNLPERTRLQNGTRDPKVRDVTPPVTINGRLGRTGARDRYQVSVRPGQRFRIAVQAAALGSYLDGMLHLSDQNGRQLAVVDDAVTPAVPGQPAFLSLDPFLDYTVPAGITLLAISLRDRHQRGGVNFGYRLTIEPAEPDFLVHQPVAEVNVPRGGSVALTVPVTRRGYAGPIQLTMPKLPDGLTVQGGYVPAASDRGILTLSAAASVRAPTDAWFIHLEGRAVLAGQPIRRRGELRVLLNSDPNLTAPVLTFRQLAVGLTAANPFTVQGPKAVEVVKGYPAAVAVQVDRDTKQAVPAVEVTGTLPVPPPGQPPSPAGTVAFKPGTVAAGAAAGTFTLTAGLNVPEGRTLDLVVQGKSRVNNQERTITGPAIALTVRNPFAVELTTPSLTAAAGQTVKLQGRLKRQTVFKEAVQVALSGLPTGVTVVAPPRPIPGNQSDFQIDLRVDAKAGPVTANLTLTCSTTIGGMAYASPAVAVPLQVTAGKSRSGKAGPGR
jgi:hypothetical protein